ncbi:hypothetical protein ES319_A05G347500v1 [Gossypium barbadense]|uniref:Uncharacterized protein n=2 Tax=Gossypium TaxID=3633 RepID=A0A5J5VYE7_GOSBA|nr:hypothetical protein ES319_A05G347500v1 [Gossypium barbadense]TYI30231.1 hypothetical protein ES332_A05G371400v1 [Gossypium tomentosum]
MSMLLGKMSYRFFFCKTFSNSHQSFPCAVLHLPSSSSRAAVLFHFMTFSNSHQFFLLVFHLLSSSFSHLCTIKRKLPMKIWTFKQLTSFPIFSFL